MKIFADEFINFIKENTICILVRHKESEWIEVQWAPGHGTGQQIKTCKRCNKELKSRGRLIDLRTYTLGNKKIKRSKEI